MNWKTWLLLVVALAAGSVASYGVKSAFFVERDDQAVGVSDSSGPKERLLVANGVIASGMELNAQNVRFELTSEKDIPRDGIFSFAEFAGRKVTRDLKDGEPISLYDVEAVEEVQSDEFAFVPPGFSIVPIEICSVTKTNGSRNYLKTTTLDKMLKPGDRVDLISIKEGVSSTSRRRLISKTVAEKVTVFAVNDESRFGVEGVMRTSVLSALLSSSQLELVRKAADEGKIKVVLNDEVSGSTEFDGVSDPGSMLSSTSNQKEDSSDVVSTNMDFQTVLDEKVTVSPEEKASKRVVANEASVGASRENSEQADASSNVASQEPNSSFVIDLSPQSDEQETTNDVKVLGVGRSVQEGDAFQSPASEENVDGSNEENDGEVLDGVVEDDLEEVVEDDVEDDEVKYDSFDSGTDPEGVDVRSSSVSSELARNPSPEEPIARGRVSFRDRRAEVEVQRTNEMKSKSSIPRETSGSSSSQNDESSSVERRNDVKRYSPFVTVSSKKGLKVRDR